MRFVNKKSLIVIMVIVMTVGLGIIGIRSFMKPKTDTKAVSEYQRTVVITKGTLEDSVAVKGTVKSAESSSVMATTAGKITDLKVREGDMVKKGDVIAVMDSADLREEIAKKKKDAEQGKTDLKATLNQLISQRDEAFSHRDQSAKEQAELVARSAKALDEARQVFDSYYTGEYSALKAQFEDAAKQIRSAQISRDDAVKKRQASYPAWAALDKDRQSDRSIPAAAVYLDAAERCAEAEEVLKDAKEVYGYDSANAAFGEAQTRLSALQAAKDSAAGAYNEALNGQKSAAASEDKALKDLDAQITEARKKWMEYSGSEDLKALEKQLEGTILRAETAGKVTELKAKIGSVPKDEIATIQSIDHLNVETLVQPYDIPKIKVGQKVLITAETAKQEIAGRVERIASTASGTDGTGGFMVVIAVEDPQSVYIGTSVTARIIISEKSDVYVVPKDAVAEEDGQSWVRSLQSDGSFKRISVETGDSNDSSIEIKGQEIKEGLEILAVYDWEGLKEQQKEKANANEGY